MCEIHSYYEAQCTADYLRENHPGWPEDKVQEIAYETRSQMDDYGFDETDAIEEAIKRYNEEHDN